MTTKSIVCLKIWFFYLKNGILGTKIEFYIKNHIFDRKIVFLNRFWPQNNFIYPKDGFLPLKLNYLLALKASFDLIIEFWPQNTSITALFYFRFRFVSCSKNRFLILKALKVEFWLQNLFFYLKGSFSHQNRLLTSFLPQKSILSQKSKFYLKIGFNSKIYFRPQNQFWPKNRFFLAESDFEPKNLLFTSHSGFYIKINFGP